MSTRRTPNSTTAELAAYLNGIQSAARDGTSGGGVGTLSRGSIASLGNEKLNLLHRQLQTSPNCNLQHMSMMLSSSPELVDSKRRFNATCMKSNFIQDNQQPLHHPQSDWSDSYKSPVAMSPYEQSASHFDMQGSKFGADLFTSYNGGDDCGLAAQSTPPNHSSLAFGSDLSNGMQPRSNSSSGFYYSGSSANSDSHQIMSAPNSVLSSTPYGSSSASSPYAQQPLSISSMTSSSMTPPSVKSQQQSMILQRPSHSSTPQLQSAGMSAGSYGTSKYPSNCDSIASSPVTSPMSVNSSAGAALPLPRCHSNSSAASNSAAPTPYSVHSGPMTPLGSNYINPGSNNSASAMSPVIPLVHIKREDNNCNSPYPTNNSSMMGSPYAANTNAEYLAGAQSARMSSHQIVHSPQTHLNIKRSPSVEPTTTKLAPFSSFNQNRSSPFSPSPANSAGYDSSVRVNCMSATNNLNPSAFQDSYSKPAMMSYPNTPAHQPQYSCYEQSPAAGQLVESGYDLDGENLFNDVDESIVSNYGHSASVAAAEDMHRHSMNNRLVPPLKLNSCLFGNGNRSSGNTYSDFQTQPKNSENPNRFRFNPLAPNNDSSPQSTFPCKYNSPPSSNPCSMMESNFIPDRAGANFNSGRCLDSFMTTFQQHSQSNQRSNLHQSFQHSAQTGESLSSASNVPTSSPSSSFDFGLNHTRLHSSPVNSNQLGGYGNSFKSSQNPVRPSTQNRPDVFSEYPKQTASNYTSISSYSSNLKGNPVENVTFDPKTGMMKVKKKRGRPRKNPLHPPVISASQMPNSSIYSTSSSSFAKMNGQQSGFKDASSFNQQPSTDVDPYVFPAFLDQTSVPISTPQSNPSNTSQINSITNISQPQAPVKRPRGRPRINDPNRPPPKPKPAPRPSLAAIIPGLAGQPLMKRGRGRPKSIKTLLKEAEAAGIRIPPEVISQLMNGNNPTSLGLDPRSLTKPSESVQPNINMVSSFKPAANLAPTYVCDDAYQQQMQETKLKNPYQTPTTATPTAPTPVPSYNGTIFDLNGTTALNSTFPTIPANFNKMPTLKTPQTKSRLPGSQLSRVVSSEIVESSTTSSSESDIEEDSKSFIHDLLDLNSKNVKNSEKEKSEPKETEQRLNSNINAIEIKEETTLLKEILPLKSKPSKKDNSFEPDESSSETSEDESSFSACSIMDTSEEDDDDDENDDNDAVSEFDSLSSSYSSPDSKRKHRSSNSGGGKLRSPGSSTTTTKSSKTVRTTVSNVKSQQKTKKRNPRYVLTGKPKFSEQIKMAAKRFSRTGMFEDDEEEEEEETEEEECISKFALRPMGKTVTGKRVDDKESKHNESESNPKLPKLVLKRLVTSNSASSNCSTGNSSYSIINAGVGSEQGQQSSVFKKGCRYNNTNSGLTQDQNSCANKQKSTVKRNEQTNTSPVLNKTQQNTAVSCVGVLNLSDDSTTFSCDELPFIQQSNLSQQDHKDIVNLCSEMMDLVCSNFQTGQIDCCQISPKDSNGYSNQTECFNNSTQLNKEIRLEKPSDFDNQSINNGNIPVLNSFVESENKSLLLTDRLFSTPPPPPSCSVESSFFSKSLVQDQLPLNSFITGDGKTISETEQCSAIDSIINLGEDLNAEEEYPCDVSMISDSFMMSSSNFNDSTLLQNTNNDGQVDSANDDDCFLDNIIQCSTNSDLKCEEEEELQKLKYSLEQDSVAIETTKTEVKKEVLDESDVVGDDLALLDNLIANESFKDTSQNNSESNDSMVNSLLNFDSDIVSNNEMPLESFSLNVPTTIKTESTFEDTTFNNILQPPSRSPISNKVESVFQNQQVPITNSNFNEITQSSILNQMAPTSQNIITSVPSQCSNMSFSNNRHFLPSIPNRTNVSIINQQIPPSNLSTAPGFQMDQIPMAPVGRMQLASSNSVIISNNFRMMPHSNQLQQHPLSVLAAQNNPSIRNPTLVLSNHPVNSPTFVSHSVQPGLILPQRSPSFGPNIGSMSHPGFVPSNGPVNQQITVPNQPVNFIIQHRQTGFVPPMPPTNLRPVFIRNNSPTGPRYIQVAHPPNFNGNFINSGLTMADSQQQFRPAPVVLNQPEPMSLTKKIILEAKQPTLIREKLETTQTIDSLQKQKDILTEAMEEIQFDTDLDIPSEKVSTQNSVKAKSSSIFSHQVNHLPAQSSLSNSGQFAPNHNHQITSTSIPSLPTIVPVESASMNKVDKPRQASVVANITEANSNSIHTEKQAPLCDSKASIDDISILDELFNDSFTSDMDQAELDEEIRQLAALDQLDNELQPTLPVPTSTTGEPSDEIIVFEDSPDIKLNQKNDTVEKLVQNEMNENSIVKDLVNDLLSQTETSLKSTECTPEQLNQCKSLVENLLTKIENDNFALPKDKDIELERISLNSNMANVMDSEVIVEVESLIQTMLGSVESIETLMQNVEHLNTSNQPTVNSGESEQNSKTSDDSAQIKVCSEILDNLLSIVTESTVNIHSNQSPKANSDLPSLSPLPPLQIQTESPEVNSTKSVDIISESDVKAKSEDTIAPICPVPVKRGRGRPRRSSFEVCLTFPPSQPNNHDVSESKRRRLRSYSDTATRVDTAISTSSVKAKKIRNSASKKPAFSSRKSPRNHSETNISQPSLSVQQSSLSRESKMSKTDCTIATRLRKSDDYSSIKVTPISHADSAKSCTKQELNDQKDSSVNPKFKRVYKRRNSEILVHMEYNSDDHHHQHRSSCHHFHRRQFSADSAAGCCCSKEMMTSPPTSTSAKLDVTRCCHQCCRLTTEACENSKLSNLNTFCTRSRSKSMIIIDNPNKSLKSGSRNVAKRARYDHEEECVKNNDDGDDQSSVQHPDISSSVDDDNIFAHKECMDTSLLSPPLSSSSSVGKVRCCRNNSKMPTRKSTSGRQVCCHHCDHIIEEEEDEDLDEDLDEEEHVHSHHHHCRVSNLNRHHTRCHSHCHDSVDCTTRGTKRTKPSANSKANKSCRTLRCCGAGSGGGGGAVGKDQPKSKIQTFSKKVVQLCPPVMECGGSGGSGLSACPHMPTTVSINFNTEIVVNGHPDHHSATTIIHINNGGGGGDGAKDDTNNNKTGLLATK